jgi:spermidine synthase
MPLYAATILLSAFLLFLVQPLIGKILLPWFGGAASVWSACLLFFQVALLGGYLYAHLVIRWLRPKTQAGLHITLLVLSAALLRVVPDPAWKPSGNEDPFLAVLALLAVCVGFPYFVLSTTGPLAQAWYARRFQVAFPYRLFAVSNLGSLLALAAYPVLVEPWLSTRHQAWAWSGAYAAFCLLCGACALRAARPAATPAEQEDTGPRAGPPVSRGTLLLWIALAACPSALLVSVTSHITQNVAPVPLLWVVPLGLYLLSLILTFNYEACYSRRWWLPLTAAALIALGYGLEQFDASPGLMLLIPLFSGALFVCCMFCHGELARSKPHSRHLTGYYLCVSLGGALGGIFAGALAPRIFPGFFELPIAAAACAVLGLLVLRDAGRPVRYAWLALTAAVALVFWHAEHKVLAGAAFAGRNFYGMLRVTETRDPRGPYSFRKLLNGTITHGLQFLSPFLAKTPTTYYSPKSGAGLAMEAVPRSSRRVGVVGLGAGTLAAYGRAGDYFRFYEINPLVVEVARREFTYLADCPAKVELALGDARISLEREPSRQFDVLALDAFSGDAIPMHLLTREAFEVYFRHLRPDGVLAVHVSNRYVELEPVVELAARALHKATLVVDSRADALGAYGARWVLLASTADAFASAVRVQARPARRLAQNLRLWTDDYSNVFQILK